MPEGPEVRVVADVIARGVGKVFTRADVIENIPGKEHRFSKNEIAHWEELQQPWTLEKVITHGKLIELEIRTPYNQLYGFSTLGMSGTWAWGLQYTKHLHTRLLFPAKDGEHLSFLDMRCYGTFRLVEEEPAKKIRNNIGWDLLSNPALANDWAGYQSFRKLKNKPVGPALLEQSVFAGIGNIYRAEILYTLGINPYTTVGSLDPALWAQVNDVSHRIMKTAYQKGGSSVDTFEADGVEGKAHEDHKVYGRASCPEGHPITKDNMKGRTMHWCMVCQTK